MATKFSKVATCGAAIDYGVSGPVAFGGYNIPVTTMEVTTAATTAIGDVLRPRLNAQTSAVVAGQETVLDVWAKLNPANEIEYGPMAVALEAGVSGDRISVQVQGAVMCQIEGTVTEGEPLTQLTSGKLATAALNGAPIFGYAAATGTDEVILVVIYGHAVGTIA